MRILTLALVPIIFFASASVNAVEKDNLQVTLVSDKSKYVINEPISLKYEVTWLGQGDAEIYFNNLALPELEVLFNQQLLALQNVRAVPMRSKLTDEEVHYRSTPGRHEIQVFPPNMRGSSRTFVINVPDQPLDNLNGVRGNYVFDKEGTYLIRAKFDISNPWKLSNKQKQTVWSNTIEIEVIFDKSIQRGKEPR